MTDISQGRTLLSLPPWELDQLQDDSPPVPFPAYASISSTSEPQILTGIRVIEMCRIIAGPAMGRTLAEYGAQVIKVTSPKLSDVPFFQVDGNTGKHTCDLDLRTPTGREAFEELLQTADVVLDGYRPGSLERLGYGPEQIVQLVKGRGKGIVYVGEDYFGNKGEWAGRPGWQQIGMCFQENSIPCSVGIREVPAQCLLSISIDEDCFALSEQLEFHSSPILSNG